MNVKMQAEFVIDDICNTLLNPPQACDKYTKNEYMVGSSSVSWALVVLVIGIGIIIFSLIVLLWIFSLLPTAAI